MSRKGVMKGRRESGEEKQWEERQEDPRKRSKA